MKNIDENRPVVGDSVLDYVGNGKPCKYGKYTSMTPKGTLGRGSSPTGKKVNRSNIQISEANGPKCHIVSKLYEKNAASSGDQGRNLRIMPSAAGVSDFQKARALTGQVY